MSFSPPSPEGPTGEQLKDLLIFFEALHEGPCGYLFVDERAQTVQFNQRACDLLCVEPSVLKNQRVFDFLLEEEHDKLQHIMDNATEHYQEPLRMVRVRCKDYAFRFVNIYVKKLAIPYLGKDLFVLLLLKNDLDSLSISNDENQIFYKAIIEAQEAEREAIGVGLHDNIAQELYAIRINLQRFIMSHGHSEHITPIKQMLNDTISKVQKMSNDLAPAVLRDMGFHRAIDDIIFKLMRSDVKFDVQIAPVINNVSKDLQFCSYQVIQELFNNCLKHADAKHISLHLQGNPSEIIITVEDDGRGFGGEVESSLQLGNGLRNIRNRIALYAGTMDLSSSLQGSKIQIKLYT